MALVTLKRSPTPSAASTASTTTTNAGEDFGSDYERRLNQSLSESFFMVKGAALFLQQGSSPQGHKAQPHHKHAGDLPQHLQVMINILRSEDRIKLAVRLESAWSDRVRYMVVVYTSGRQDTEENILLGIDFSNKDSKSCSVGMVLPLWSDTKIHLDGDGGFSVNTVSRNHVFKPVSVQAMWSALQILHKVCEVSRRYNYFPGGMALTWMGFYEGCIASEQSCINEWNAMRDLETLRPDSPTMFVDKPTERERTECLIKAKLRSIMMFQDLENVTSKQIRTELEQHMSCNLMQYKEFIDNEMLLILGQMDKAALIFDHLYLGSEWNASNLEELQDTGVGYILNVTREIDNFFPGTFSYHNIRVYDEETTDLLAHWNETYNFIVKAKKNHSKCLVHCKMGVSRSASTVIAYAMKEYGWSLEKAYDFVKQKRSITRPNAGFMRQLAEYEGILDASKQRHNKLWRPNRPDPECDLQEGQQAQCCGREDPDNRTPEPGMSPCCEEALGEKGAARPLSPCRMISLEVDPAYNNYYFRRLSDSALDSDPSTPVRAPPLLDMERVFIEIEDVERDALLDDEAFGGREGLPLPHFGLAGEGTAAQTCCRGPDPLEELRLRLEFSTVEEEDEEEAQKEEAEMEALAQPGGRGGSPGRGDGEGEVEMVQEEEREKEGNGLDLVTLNQNSNNNNHFNTLSRLNDTAPSKPAHPVKPSALSRSDEKPSHGVYSLIQDADLCLNPTPLPSVPSVSVEVPSSTLPLPPTSPDTPCSPSLLNPCGPLCDCANCAAPPSTPLPDAQDSPCSLTSENRADILEGEGEEGKLLGVSEPLPVPELLGLSLEEERPVVACCVAQQQETLVHLQRSGLVRRRAERLERLSGLSLEGLHPLESPGAREGPRPVEGKFSAFPGDFPKSSTPCPVCLELLVVPLPNETNLGAVRSEVLKPTSSSHNSTLTRSSSSDSIRSVRGKPGLVRQRAQEIETRMRLAGLTVPSSLKRSNSLAKLGSLNFSSEDLCSVCSSDAGTLLLHSLSPEPGLEWECPSTSTSTSTSTQPRAHRNQTSPERALPRGGRS
ncbi:protein phosphatase Slingshot homolog 1 isoform X1 [Coregonus clupeaformis]|uniref:protein phosphatase Slingshot homolog 1 isoform X1 n=1 Tax=Coregonus clupeaformis TaxID=59861 RepID=UPI001BE027CE|nr:protein phosphatase Slingshot homolog 1 isoform X1 [Coregonus clupeaformis]